MHDEHISKDRSDAITDRPWERTDAITGKPDERAERARRYAEMTDDEIAAELLGVGRPDRPAWWPLWLRVLKWLGIAVCIVVLPLGICVLSCWVMWRFYAVNLRYLARGIAVPGEVVGDREESDSVSARTYQAVVEYTFDGVRYTTEDGPCRSRPWQLGETVRIHHIPGSGEPGRYTSVVPLVVFMPLLIVVNVLAVGLALHFGGELARGVWDRVTGK
jgi:hypothetical protein